MYCILLPLLLYIFILLYMYTTTYTSESLYTTTSTPVYPYTTICIVYYYLHSCTLYTTNSTPVSSYTAICTTATRVPVYEYVEWPDDACDGDCVEGYGAHQLPALQGRHVQAFPLTKRFYLNKKWFCGIIFALVRLLISNTPPLGGGEGWRIP